MSYLAAMLATIGTVTAFVVGGTALWDYATLTVPRRKLARRRTMQPTNRITHRTTTTEG